MNESFLRQASVPAFLKRCLDLVLGIIILCLALPLMILLVLQVKIDSPGSVIFTDLRLGRHGKVFKCYKFRTMNMESAQLIEKYWQDNPESREEWEKYGKLKRNDPRVTRCGKWLRRSSMDELPQLFNVLRGEMSLVGPRPYLFEEKSAMGEYADIIMAISPGITGLWQVSGRNELEFKERLRIDVNYVCKRSCWLDTLILLRTIVAVISRKGAY
ncbi:MAG: sugar transferase [Syntrophomonadaceae bacterium]|nr:sugar transferase [Syntrophomonadaceae bacterium]